MAELRSPVQAYERLLSRKLPLKLDDPGAIDDPQETPKFKLQRDFSLLTEASELLAQFMLRTQSVFL